MAVPTQEHVARLKASLSECLLAEDALCDAYLSDTILKKFLTAR